MLSEVTCLGENLSLAVLGSYCGLATVFTSFNRCLRKKFVDYSPLFLNLSALLLQGEFHVTDLSDELLGLHLIKSIDGISNLHEILGAPVMLRAAIFEVTFQSLGSDARILGSQEVSHLFLRHVFELVVRTLALRQHLGQRGVHWLLKKLCLGFYSDFGANPVR